MTNEEKKAKVHQRLVVLSSEVTEGEGGGDERTVFGPVLDRVCSMWKSSRQRMQ